MKGLASLGLVRLDENEHPKSDAPASSGETGARSTEDELAALDQQLKAMGVASVAPASVEPELHASVDTDIPEGLELQDIYSSAEIVSGPYPYERFVDVVNKMSAKGMTVDQQVQTIDVMDMADEGWTIQDVANEARAKCEALVGYQQMLKSTVEAMAKDAAVKRQELQERSDAEIANLRQQIEELQQRIQTNMADTTVAMNAVSERLSANRLAAERESNRIQEHIVVMKQLDGIFFKSIPVESSTPNTNQ